MKAQVSSPMIPSSRSGFCSVDYKITKKHRMEQEMQNLFVKLQEIVPTGSEKQMGKVELLQSVIDYIFDLETVLEEPDSTKKIPLIASHQNNIAVKADSTSSDGLKV